MSGNSSRCFLSYSCRCWSSTHYRVVSRAASLLGVASLCELSSLMVSASCVCYKIYFCHLEHSSRDLLQRDLSLFSIFVVSVHCTRLLLTLFSEVVRNFLPPLSSYQLLPRGVCLLGLHLSVVK